MVIEMVSVVGGHFAIHSLIHGIAYGINGRDRASYFVSGRKRSIRPIRSACLSSVRSHISKTTCPSFTKFDAYVTYGRGSVSSDDSAVTLCTSGFVDDVMFSYNGTLRGLALSTWAPFCNIN